MAKPICRYVTLPIDRVIADNLTFGLRYARTLRGAFEEAYPESKDLSKTEEERFGKNGEKILKYWNERTQQEKDNILAACKGDTSLSYANAYQAVNKVFTDGEISAVKSIISRAIVSYGTELAKLKASNSNFASTENLVTKALSEHPELKERFNDVDFEHIDNVILSEYLNTYFLMHGLQKGYIDLDEFMHQIYEITYATMQSLSQIDNEAAGVSSTIINAAKDFLQNPEKNFHLFNFLAKDEIKLRTGISIGRKSKFVQVDSNEQTDDIELEETQVKDGYDTDRDSRDIYAKSSSSIRILLSSVPKVIRVNGKLTIQRDNSNNSQNAYYHPYEVHQMISRALEGCATPEDMVNALKNSNNPSLKYLADAIMQSEQLQADLFKDFLSYKQGFSGYTVQSPPGRESSTYRNDITGSFKRFTFRDFAQSLLKGLVRGKNAAKNLIFSTKKGASNDMDIIVSRDRWEALSEYIDNHITVNNGLPLFDHEYLDTMSFEECAYDFIDNVLNGYLGLSVSKGTINILIQEDPILFKSLLKNLTNLTTFDFPKGTDVNKNFNDIVKGTELKSSFSRIMDILNEATDKNSLRIRYDKSTLNKNALPNEVGIAFNKILSFTKKAAHANNTEELNRVVEELHQYIEDTYLKSTEYYTIRDGKKVPLNDWIAQLYSTTAAELTDPDSFINNFANSGNKALYLKEGYREVLTKKMNERQNIQTFMLSYFLASRGESGLGVTNFADYAMFTMGDSQVIRTIRAQKYNYSDIQDKFADIAEQELNRMALEQRAAKNIRARGNKNSVSENTEGEYNIDISNIILCANKDVEGSGKFVYLSVLNNHLAELQEALNSNNPDHTNIEAFRDKVKEILFGSETREAALFNEFSKDFFNEIQSKYPTIFETKELKRYDPITETEKTNTVFNVLPMLAYSDVFSGEGDQKQVKLDSTNPLLMYYLNAKLANIMQFQFLKKHLGNYSAKNSEGFLDFSSVVLQKRFKAVNTPGIHLNINRVFKGKKVGKTHEKVIYFKEFRKSIVDTDPKAFLSIVNAHSKNLGLGYHFDLTTAEKLGTIKKYMDGVVTQLKNDHSEGGKTLWNKVRDYLKTKSTDGQGFRTLSSYRDVMLMADSWSDAQEDAYNALMGDGKTPGLRAQYKQAREAYEEAVKRGDEIEAEKYDTKAAKLIDKINELCDVNFQPIKPHVSSSEEVQVGESVTDNDIMYVAVEHKYAEAIILPELYDANSEMRAIGEYLEENNIDLACSEECVKVGNWGAVDIQNQTDSNGFYNAEGTKSSTLTKGTPKLPTDQIKGKLSNAIVHNISYADYEIQGNKPQHLDIDALIGTQLRKQIFATIAKTGDYNLLNALTGGRLTEFTVAGNKYDLSDPENGSQNLIKLYNALVAKGFVNRFLDVVDTMSDPELLSNLLSNLKRNDNKSMPSSITRYATRNGKFRIPIGEPTLRYENETYLLSHFKKAVNKQRMSGSAFVQVTDLGLNDLQTHFDENGNVTYHDCAVTWDLSVNINGKQVPLKFSDWCHADGTLKTDKEGNTLIEKKYPGILDKIAWRIPTERMYSCLNLRVKRFLPKSMGGVIAVPSYLVTAAGFDFDIDVLYSIKRSYDINRVYDKDKVKEIWDNIYTQGEQNGMSYADILRGYRDGEIRNFIKQITKARPKKGLEEIKLFYDNSTPEKEDIFWRIVNSKDIKERAAKLGIKIPSRELYSYWSKANLPGDYQSYFDNYCERNNINQEELGYKDYLSTPNMDEDIINMSDNTCNNLFFDIVQSRISDPLSMDARFTPGGFEHAKNAAAVMKAITYGQSSDIEYKGKKLSEYSLKELVDLAENDEDARDFFDSLEPSYDPTNPLTAAIYNARNIIAKEVIGIMANHNTNYAYSRIMDTFEVKVPVTLFDKETSNLIGIDGRTDLVSPDLGLAELLASSVDAVKAPVLNFLNINNNTANVAALLTRLGYSSLEVGLFLNQPVIKRLCSRMSDKGSSNLTNACKSLYKEEFKDDYAKGPLVPEMIKINADTLFKNLSKENSNDQRDVLKVFMQLANQASALNDFIVKTKFTAANSIDNTMGSVIETTFDIKNTNTGANNNIAAQFNIKFKEGEEEKISPIDTEYFKSKKENDGLSKIEAMKDFEDYFKFLLDSPFAFEQAMYDAIDGFTEAISKFLPYNTAIYQKLYQILNNTAIYGGISAEIIDAVHNMLPTYLLGVRDDSYFNPEGPLYYNVDTGAFSRVYVDGYEKTTNFKFFTEIFPEKVAKFLDDVDELRAIKNHSSAIFNSYYDAKQRAADGDQEAVSKMAELRQMYAEVGEQFNQQRDKILSEYKLFADGTNVLSLLDNPLIQSLDYNIEPYQTKRLGKTISSVRYVLRLNNSSQFDNNIKATISEGWGILGDPANGSPSFAQAIYFSNFFNKGFSVDSNMFNNVVPESVLEMLMLDPRRSYLESIEGLLNTDNISDDNIASMQSFHIDNFLKLLYRANSSNYKLVKPVYSTLTTDKTTIEDNNGVSCIISRNNNRISISTANNQRITESEFIISGSFTPIGEDTSKGYYRAVPAFTIESIEGGQKVTKLYVREKPSNPYIPSNAESIDYVEVSLPQTSRTVTFSESILGTNVSDTSLEEAPVEAPTSISGIEYGSASSPIIRNINRVNNSLDGFRSLEELEAMAIAAKGKQVQEENRIHPCNKK